MHAPAACVPVILLGSFCTHTCATTALQVDVLVEGFDDDDNLVGRTQWDAIDIDPVVFLTPASDPKHTIARIRSNEALPYHWDVAV